MVAGVFFSALAIWLTFPLVVQLETHIPGEGAGDNLTFLWNAWWFREWAEGQADRLFFTDRLFAPVGTSLVLHTHTVLPSALAFLVPVESLVAKHNVALIAGLALNGITTYALAYRQVKEVVPSLAAGLLFASGAYVCVHLLGHFNLIHAWVVPLALLAWIRFIELPSAGRGAVLGLAVAVVGYTDYYYTVYVLGIFAIWQCSRSLACRVTGRPRLRTTPMKVIAALIVAAAGLAIAITIFGDLSFGLVGNRISLRNSRNPMTVLYALVLAAVVYGSGVRLTLRRKRDPRLHLSIAGWSVAIVSTLVLSAPIFVAALQLLLDGGYVSPRILWRSSPSGVDFVTLFLGHPWHWLTGDFTRSLMTRLSIDQVEQSAWVGLVALCALWSWRPHFEERSWTIWAALGIVFGLLAAGPFLRFAGVDTGLPLPWAFLRYVPILSNARIPGRAMVVVVLAVSMLLAFGLRGRRGWPRIAVAAALAFELSVRPVPLYQLPQIDAVDRALRDDRAVVVAELPTGLRDGFGETGHFDHRALVHQSFHGRPLVGGFVARLSPKILDAHRRDPGVMALIADSIDLPATISHRFPFVVLNTDVLPEPELLRSRLRGAGYRLIVAAGPRELYGAGS